MFYLLILLLVTKVSTGPECGTEKSITFNVNGNPRYSRNTAPWTGRFVLKKETNFSKTDGYCDGIVISSQHAVTTYQCLLSNGFLNDTVCSKDTHRLNPLPPVKLVLTTCEDSKCDKENSVRKHAATAFVLGGCDPKHSLVVFQYNSAVAMSPVCLTDSAIQNDESLLIHSSQLSRNEFYDRAEAKVESSLVKADFSKNIMNWTASEPLIRLKITGATEANIYTLVGMGANKTFTFLPLKPYLDELCSIVSICVGNRQPPTTEPASTKELTTVSTTELTTQPTTLLLSSKTGTLPSISSTTEKAEEYLGFPTIELPKDEFDVDIFQNDSTNVTLRTHTKEVGAAINQLDFMFLLFFFSIVLLFK